MKKYCLGNANYKCITLLVIILIVISGFTYGQRPVPNAYSLDLKINHVRTWEATAPETDPQALITKPLRDVKQSTAYYDGLGRILQTVVKQGSLSTGGNATDFVSPVEYDAFGREQYKYLPFAANNTGNNTSINDGAFKYNPYNQQATFAATQYPDENFYYSHTNFESSPLSRVDKTMAAGKSWVGNSRGVEIKYWTNTAVDSVFIFGVTNGALENFGTYSISGTYADGQLFKSVTIDEHGKQVIEFKDKSGRVLLKKMQLTASVDVGGGSGYTGWLCTYYIYDDLNNLRCVVQPRGVELLLNNNWNIDALNGDILNEQCFRYEYDARNRMILKKAPGAVETIMIYDARDRVVMTQDANMRSRMQWLVTQYDEINRVTATYLIIDAANYNNSLLHRSNANSSITYPNVSDYTSELLTETHYDNYNGAPPNFSVTGLYASGYGNYLDAPASDFPEPLTVERVMKGRVTWTRMKVLNENKYITSCNLYDSKGRVIQVQTVNYSGAMDITTNQYSFSGQLLRSHMKHEVTGPKADRYDVGTKKVYDDLGRIISLEKNINGSGWKQVVAMTYNALGQIKTKNLSPSFNNTLALETLDYEYNIRGWVLGANREYAKSPSASDHYFGFDLGYDKQTIGSLGTYVNVNFNGNITGTVWKSKGDGAVRKYDFIYDAANRLIDADFNQYNSGFNKSAGIDFSVSNLSYDANGNIGTQNQKGLKLGGSDYIDQLTYEYLPNSNKLKTVVDGYNNTQTTLGDFRSSEAYMNVLGGTKNTAATDYGYDGNGNLIIDKNKDITNITYNHLNLPQIVTFSAKGSVEYVYDAEGNKLKKIVHETGKPDKNTLYLFGVYENDVLQFFPMEEGRIRAATDGSGNLTGFIYDYFVKDHLGNVRMVLTEQMEHKGYMATMENGPGNEVRTHENQLFSNLDVSAYSAQTAGFPPYGSVIDPNLVVARVNGGNQKKGPSTVLKVMAGDVIDIGVRYFYKQNNNTPVQGNVLNEILSSLAGGIVSASGVAKGTLTELSDPVSSPVLGALNTFRQNNNQGLPDKPKAYLNWILLDEQFKYVGTFPQSNAIPVGGPDEALTLAYSGIEITKNGYLYVYVSNETENWDVFFDDLTVMHHTGPLLEETHYYPFGLTMAGISSKALTTLVNRRLYAANEIQNNEFANGSGLELYDFNARTYDPQLGRFIQIDPKTDEGGQERLSPFHYSYNNPILYTDPDGKIGFIGALIGGAIGGVASLTKSVIQGGWKALKDKKTWAKAGVNAAAGAIVGATGGLGAGLVATAGTAFASSIAEDAIDGNKLDFKKATVSAFVSVATFGIASAATSKLTKEVTRHWWNRGNTNAFMRYLGRSPATNVGQLVDRAADAAGLGSSLGLDLLFPGQPLVETLPGVTVTGKKIKGNVQLDEQSVEEAVDVMHQNNKIIKNEKKE